MRTTLLFSFGCLGLILSGCDGFSEDSGQISNPNSEYLSAKYANNLLLLLNLSTNAVSIVPSTTSIVEGDSNTLGWLRRIREVLGDLADYGALDRQVCCTDGQSLNSCITSPLGFSKSFEGQQNVVNSLIAIAEDPEITTPELAGHLYRQYGTNAGQLSAYINQFLQGRLTGSCPVA